MKLKKNNFVLLYVISILLLMFVLLLSVYITQYSKKIILKNNQFVKDQVIINPDANSLKVIERMMTINLKAETDKSLQWDFKVLEDTTIKVKIGENNIVKFEGKNFSNKTITASANFIVLPDKISPYLIKTECFCFTEQTLNPGASQTFTMVFFLDPSLNLDKDLDNIKDLVFTYHLSEYKS